MYMRNADATSRIKNLFVNYHTLLRKHGLTWLLDCNKKMAVQHVLKAIGPAKVQRRLRGDLGSSHFELQIDFNGLFAH